MATTKSAPRPTGQPSAAGNGDAPSAPVLKVTLYDRISSFLLAAVIALAAIVVWLVAVWFTNRIPEKEGPIPLELVELAGGVEDGAIDETLKVDSPEEESIDPTVAEELNEEIQIEEVFDNVIDLADAAANQAEQQFEQQIESTGKPSSAEGTGRRALGMGPGQSGFPREQRWFVRFSDRGTLDEYASQLEHFGIELGALVGSGKLVYLSDLTSEKPKTRTSNTGAGEKRLYMTWQGGERRKGDLMLFQKAGVEVGGGVIFHFYPKKTESMLANLEHDYRGKPADQIRRTYFVVRRAEGGYQFEVTQQTFLR